MTPEPERSALTKKYKNNLVEDFQLGSYISYTGNKKIPFLNIYKFEEAFSFPLVWELLKMVNATGIDYVIDPFCGYGTTLFTCLVKGIRSVGVDALPLACFMSKTLPQFLFLRKGELDAIWKKGLPKIETCKPALIAADVPIMKVAFQKDILMRLRKMKTAIDELEEPYNKIFLVLFFSLLEECSSTVKEKRYPTVMNHKKGADPIDIMNKRIKTVEKDIVRAKKYCVRKENLPHVFLGNTKELSAIVKRKRNPTVLITSPPYADKIDYVQSYALELCFHFVKDFEEFKALQHTLLRSHIVAEIAEGEKPPHPVVKEIVTRLKDKTKKIPDMVTAYFLDMEKVIHEWYTMLGTTARVAVVLDNLCYEGVVIPVDLVLSDMAEAAGFAVEKIIVAGYKGKIPVRESILMWKK